MNHTTPLKLSSGGSVHIFKELTVGHAEDIAELEDAWGQGLGPNKLAMVNAQARAVIGIHSIDPPEGSNPVLWPDLTFPLSATSAPVVARRNHLKRTMKVADLMRIASEVNQRLFVGAQLEGNSEAQSNSETETGTDLTSSGG